MPAGTDEQRGAEGVIDDPAAVPAHDGLDRLVQAQAGAGAAQQVIIEFAPADAEAHLFAIIGLRLGIAQTAGAKAGNRLEHVVAAIRLGIQFQGTHHRRRDPTGADLVAREVLLVQHQDIVAGPAQPPGGGGTGRPPAYHQHIAVFHRPHLPHSR